MVKCNYIIFYMFVFVVLSKVWCCKGGCWGDYIG